MTTFGLEDKTDIDLKLDGLRDEVKNNGCNAKEAGYYDKQNNHVYTVTYDRNGKLEDTPMGIAIIQRKYDVRGNLIEQSYNDQDRKAFRTEFIGPAIDKYKHDQDDNKGNVIEECHLENKRQLTDGICIF